jgi:hypothetical protein
MGRIVERRHTAISMYSNGIAAERHSMPKKSDCPRAERARWRVENLLKMFIAIERVCVAPLALPSNAV